VRLRLSAERIERELTPIHPCAPAVAERLATWSEVLDKWSRVQRLVGWRSATDLLREGLADAWAMVPLLEPTEGPMVDVGSGNGLPGLVIAAALPARPVHLVESQRKRVSFLKEAVRQMALTGVVVHHGRAEVVRDRADAPTRPVFFARAWSSPAEVLAAALTWNSRACVLSTTPPPPELEGWRLADQRAGRPADRRLHARYEPV